MKAEKWGDLIEGASYYHEREGVFSILAIGLQDGRRIVAMRRGKDLSLLQDHPLMYENFEGAKLIGIEDVHGVVNRGGGLWFGKYPGIVRKRGKKLETEFFSGISSSRGSAKPRLDS